MKDDQSSSQEHTTTSNNFGEEKDSDDIRTSSILRTGSKNLNKCVSFSEWNSVFLIPHEKQGSGGLKRRCGYLLDVKQTFTNLLDHKCLAEVDEDAEVELMNVVHDEQLDNVKPIEYSGSTCTKEIVACCSTTAVAHFHLQGEQITGQKNLHVDLASKSILSSDRHVDELDKVGSFKLSGDDLYSCSNEELTGNRFNKISVEETSEERKSRHLRRYLQSTIAKDNPHEVKQKGNKQRPGGIGSQTCEVIKDYIVGLSGRGNSSRFRSADLAPMYVAVRGTLSNKVMREESKSKHGLDLVGTHKLRIQNINCAFHFYYDEYAKEIAENTIYQR